MTDALEVRKKRLADINGVDILADTEVLPPVSGHTNEGPATRQDIANTTKVVTFRAAFYPEDDPEYVQRVEQYVADMVANAGMPTLSAEAMMFEHLKFRDPNRVQEENVIRKNAQAEAGSEDYKQASFTLERGVAAVGYRGSGPINFGQLLPNPDMDDAGIVEMGKDLLGRISEIEDMHVIVAGKHHRPEVGNPPEAAQIAQTEVVQTPAMAAPPASNGDNPFLKIDPEDIGFAPGWDKNPQS